MDFRNVAQGSARGWGLHHSDIGQEVSNHPLYQLAYERAKNRTLVNEERLKNFFLIIRDGLRDLESKNVIEFGTYKGGTAIFMATLMKELYPEAKFYALDSYEGMPETDSSIDMHGKGDFGDADAGELQKAADEFGLDNLVVVKGFFEDSFPTLSGKYGLCHIDCDIIDGVRYAQKAVWQHMVPGGYLIYDDANAPSCIGATQAMEEMIIDRRIFSEQAWPHYVFRT
jgi:predicted O-methyltransferase YrrM